MLIHYIMQPKSRVEGIRTLEGNSAHHLERVATWTASRLLQICRGKGIRTLGAPLRRSYAFQAYAIDRSATPLNFFAEKEGFEPSCPVSRTVRFRDGYIQPLCHFSNFADSGRIELLSCFQFLRRGIPSSYFILRAPYTTARSDSFEPASLRLITPEICGESRIRTHGPVARSPDFKSGAIDQLCHLSNFPICQRTIKKSRTLWVRDFHL